MKFCIFLILCFTSLNLSAQELFTWTEPASNMAAKSIGFRLTNTLMKQEPAGNYSLHLLPEIMWGVSGKVMVHAEAFLSTRNKNLMTEGGAFYLKYRLLSLDDVHSHFRIAAYGRTAVNNSDVHQRAIDLNGHNSGYEGGLIFTKLSYKVAVSAGAAFLHATDNAKNNKYYFGDNSRNALGYNFSVGKLMLPKEYVSYTQTNMNFMVELLGQTNLGNGKSFVDLAPTVQFIILSKMRVDAGYRFAVVKDLDRTALGGFLLRLEYNIFNAYK